MNTTTVKAKRTSRKNWAKILVTALAVLVCIIGLGFVYERFASLQAKQNYPPPGKLVDVGGFRLHVKKIGIGSPTIIFEAGSRESSHIWRDIPEQLVKDATVVTYDRAGYGWSEQGGYGTERQPYRARAAYRVAAGRHSRAVYSRRPFPGWHVFPTVRAAV
ncbi:alpha/beta hydrolase [Paenibacillus uliginis]|uniref:alpha/beta fold hydrolase n=1 Tax=Paenibacillus uliginis TaxID=683737 RepID=UPI00313B054E